MTAKLPGAATMFSILSLLLTAPAVAGCGTQAEADAVLAQIEAANLQIESLLPAGNIEGYVSNFTEDAFQASPNSMPLEGRTAMLATWQGMAGIGRWSFDLETLEVWVCNGSAVERGYGELSFEPGENAPDEFGPFTAGAHFVAHWVLDDDGAWRIRSEAAASIPAPSE